MKANELQISDWVNFLIDVEGGDTENDPQNEVYQPMQVNTIASWEVGGEVESREGVINDPEQLLPIPLTAEILEKNGFEKSVSPPGIHAKCYEIYNKDEKYCLTIADYNKYKRLLLNIDSEDSECFNIRCDYVHQLQHALRLCNIEKEIEL